MKMPKTIFACCLVVLGCFRLCADSIPKEHRVILPPATSGAQWTPSAALTVQAERAVLRHLKQVLDSKPADPWQKKAIPEILKQYSTYHVQFVGRSSDGHQRIFCNYFLGDSALASDWRRQQVFVDDGGWSFWQIEYDVETDKCVNLQINGDA